MTNEVNDLSKSRQGHKIGGKDEGARLNREAATSQAAAMMQLNQLQNGEDVMKTESAKSEIADIVDTVATKYDGVKRTDAGNNLSDAKTAYKKNTTFGSKSHKEAAKHYKDAKENYVAQTKSMTANSKRDYKEAKSVQNVSNLIASEFIQGQIAARSKQTKESTPINERVSPVDRGTKAAPETKRPNPY